MTVSVCSFCGDRRVVAWFEGPSFRQAVDSAEKVRSDETYLACSECLALVQAGDRHGLAARELVRQRRKGRLKRGLTGRDVIRFSLDHLEDTFWRARAE